MNRDRLVYYVVFPLVVVALCLFSYYLGWSRGQQTVSISGTTGKKIQNGDSHPIGGELTFFKTLKATDDETPPIPPERLRKVDKHTEIDRVGAGSSVVQVSAFRDIGKAHELVDQLKNLGFSSFTRSSSSQERGRWYRVHVGPYASKKAATDGLERLMSKGFNDGFITELEIEKSER